MEARKPAACWDGRNDMAECHKNDMDEDYCRVEIERLREALDFYANPVNWWWDSERNSWIWMGDNHPHMTTPPPGVIAVTPGVNSTGVILTPDVKLSPPYVPGVNLTPLPYGDSLGSFEMSIL